MAFLGSVLSLFYFPLIPPHSPLSKSPGWYTYQPLSLVSQRISLFRAVPFSLPFSLNLPWTLFQIAAFFRYS
ncbi:hypothetical protein M408DRAFT_252337 [Serendipita vermifera MAFF 305830]|uniref:Uncharacterized protein n=1 Tax=Serendipita vermifera MAFF 305830 TaxID=933852 RepID=A0A0C3AWM1_SERVB|nr:hypothetical protein M408DRAFT_252337 [Serendipita vermifera MAFF 305830]